MNIRLFVSCLILPLFAVVSVGENTATAPAAARGGSSKGMAEIILVDGETFTARPVSVGKTEAVFLTAGRTTRKVPIRDLWRIRFSDSLDLMNRPGKKVITLVGEGMVAVKSVGMSGEKITAKCDLFGDASFKMSSVATIYLPRRGRRPTGLEKRCEEMSLRNGKQDCLVAEDKKGNWIPVMGALRAVTPEKVTFRFNQTDRTVGMEYVRVIKLAKVSQKAVSPTGRIIGKDGSLVPFTSFKLAGSKLSITATGLVADAVNLPAVAEIRFRSDRFVYLSDLKSEKIVQAGLFGDTVFHYRRDRSSAGGPLRVGKKTYTKGVGMHSRCELTYDLAGKYVLFAASAGIDHASGKRGDATLKIIGDGKELLKSVKLTGQKEATPVRCDVTGVKKLTIVVGFGKDGIGVGDHVDLGEARLIKK